MPDGTKSQYCLYYRWVNSYTKGRRWRLLRAWADDKLSLEERMDYGFGHLFARLAPQLGYRLNVGAVVVDVSMDDVIKDVKFGNTPYKVLARVDRSRKARGFGENSWGDEDIASAATPV
jgi:hypothetical protein